MQCPCGIMSGQVEKGESGESGENGNFPLFRLKTVNSLLNTCASCFDKETYPLFLCKKWNRLYFNRFERSKLLTHSRKLALRVFTKKPTPCFFVKSKTDFILIALKGQNCLLTLQTCALCFHEETYPLFLCKKWNRLHFNRFDRSKLFTHSTDLRFVFSQRNIPLVSKWKWNWLHSNHFKRSKLTTNSDWFHNVNPLLFRSLSFLKKNLPFARLWRKFGEPKKILPVAHLLP